MRLAVKKMVFSLPLESEWKVTRISDKQAHTTEFTESYVSKIDAECSVDKAVTVLGVLTSQGRNQVSTRIIYAFSIYSHYNFCFVVKISIT